MDTARAHLAVDRTLASLGALDLAACRLLQRRSGDRTRAGFSLVSRLGDGWLWLGLAIALLVAGGDAALATVGSLLLAAALGLPLYALLKRRTARPRPCAAAGDLEALVPALDLYSFPSGHPLHAVAFTVVVLARYPGLAWLLVPFTLLVALSRVVLGLHYPTDVLAGAALGGLLGAVARGLV